MWIYRRPKSPPVVGCVLALGNFDGVHRGHQAIIKALCAQSDAHHPPLLMSFHPHPKTLITGRSPALLTTLRDRAFWLQHYGIEHWWRVPFNESLRALLPESFIEHYVLPLKPKALFVGADYRFGYQGKGNIETLQQAGQRHGFGVVVLEDYQHDGARISSSQIRHALQHHQLERAKALLGHDLTFTGMVQTGFGRGKALLARTANFHLPEAFALPNGVYVVACDNLSDSRVWGVANVGINPTFNGKHRKLEVHFFMPERDLYGKTLRIAFHHFLREEKRFDSPSALAFQIQRDIEQAQHYLSQQESS